MEAQGTISLSHRPVFEHSRFATTVDFCVVSYFPYHFLLVCLVLRFPLLFLRRTARKCKLEAGGWCNISSEIFLLDLYLRICQLNYGESGIEHGPLYESTIAIVLLSM